MVLHSGAGRISHGKSLSAVAFCHTAIGRHGKHLNKGGFKPQALFLLYITEPKK